jgi:hypothetical protein
MVSRYRDSLKKSNKIKHDEYSGGTPDGVFAPYNWSKSIIEEKRH